MVEYQCGRVLLGILTNDLAWTTATSNGEASGKLVVYYRWSLNSGQLSRIAGTVLGSLLFSFLMV